MNVSNDWSDWAAREFEKEVDGSAVVEAIEVMRGEENRARGVPTTAKVDRRRRGSGHVVENRHVATVLADDKG